MSYLTSILRICRSRLACKFSLAALVIILSMGIVIYFIADATIRNNLHELYRQKGEAIAANLATGAADLLLLDNSARLQLLLKNTQQSGSEIVYIFIISPPGQVPAHTFPGGFPDDLKKIPQPADDQRHRVQKLDTGDFTVLDIAAPIVHGSLGYAHVGFSLEPIEKRRRHSQLQIFWTCVLASFLSILVAVLFSRHITKPLTALAQGADFIGQGHLDHRLEITGRDEIGVTAQAFNQMAESLQKDIAERLTAEKALQKSEEIYRTLVENIDMGIVLIDHDHTVLKANAAQGRFFNKAPQEFHGQKCFAEFERRDDVCPHCPGLIAMLSGNTAETVAQGTRDDGTTLTVNIKAFPVQSENGRSEKFIEVVEDITEQLKTRQDLAAEKERLSVTLRSIGDGVITTDTAGNVVLINKVAEELTGWTSHDAQGRPLEEVFKIINDQSREACENPVTKVLSSGQIIGLADHSRLVAKDGTERHIADSGAPIRDDRNTIIGVVLVFRDVTEQLRTEKELIKIKKLESVGVLAGGIAHDFNNILTAILGNINLALFDTNIGEKTRRLLDAAEKASLRAKDLTQQLLTFAKGGEPVKETSSLENVIKDSANFVLHGDKVACRFKIPADLWLADIDRGQISQVIQNIVINASHAMPEGGLIAIACENVASSGESAIPFLSKGDYLKISIADSGIGIPARIIEKIFDPYFSTKHGGSGLGLAISQSIIRKHGGHIAVQSEPEVGTVFTLYLPAAVHDTASATIAWQPSPTEMVPVKARILVMDDEKMVHGVAKAMLIKMGHEVEQATDGEEAVRIFRESLQSAAPLDLIIMDLTIPGGMGGKEAVREVHAIAPGTRVIVASGYSNDPVMAKHKDFGFCAAIVKPFQFNELERVIHQALAHVPGRLAK